MLTSAALLLVWGSRLTFLLDELELLLYRPGFTADSILSPHGEHISIAPVLIYKGCSGTARRCPRRSPTSPSRSRSS